ncbi:carbohydrate ABC transporter permease [Paenibacillus sp. FSL R10-2734]|uniref:carbohydrate ABC transporter permease n=1 Tax=Paenibacillus sp. FSL R10-2734 TaxID=2954691 RepID=UPI0030D86265
MEKKNKLINLGLELLMVLIGILMLVPAYIAIVNAFKPAQETGLNPFAFPTSFYLKNYLEVFQTIDMWAIFKNSFIITAATLILMVVTSSMAAFTIQRKANRWTGAIYLLFLAGMMIPPQTLYIPMIKLLKTLGLMQSFGGLLLFYIGLYMPFCIFLFTGFMKSVPRELDESATMDGCGTIRMYWQIVFPLLKPATSTVIIFVSMWTWNDFINPFIFLGAQKGETITLAFYAFISQYNTSWNHAFAGMIITSLPAMLLFMLMQKQFISGITTGAVKG